MGRPKTRENAKAQSIRFPRDVYETIKRSADANERSFSQEMIYRLRIQMLRAKKSA
jgi:hypothetical protein